MAFVVDGYPNNPDDDFYDDDIDAEISNRAEDAIDDELMEMKQA